MPDALIDIAETALEYWAGPGVSRETATALLPTWRHAATLSDAERVELLSRFELAEPVMVANVDYFPPAIEAHHEYATWFGYGNQDSGVRCSCGEAFDGFATVAHAREALDAHIRDAS